VLKSQKPPAHKGEQGKSFLILQKLENGNEDVLNGKRVIQI